MCVCEYTGVCLCVVFVLVFMRKSRSATSRAACIVSLGFMLLVHTHMRVRSYMCVPAHITL